MLDLDLDLGHRPGRPLGAAQRERRRVVLLENPMLLDVTVEVAYREGSRRSQQNLACGRRPTAPAHLPNEGQARVIRASYGNCTGNAQAKRTRGVVARGDKRADPHTRQATRSRVG